MTSVTKKIAGKTRRGNDFDHELDCIIRNVGQMIYDNIKGEYVTPDELINSFRLCCPEKLYNIVSAELCKNNNEYVNINMHSQIKTKGKKQTDPGIKVFNAILVTICNMLIHSAENSKKTSKLLNERNLWEGVNNNWELSTLLRNAECI